MYIKDIYIYTMENKLFEQPYINIKNSPKEAVVIGFGGLINPTFHYTLIESG